jgi:hypothetical protein
MFLSYTGGDTVLSLAGSVGADGSTVKVKGPTNIEISSTWNDMFLGVGTTLSSTLLSAGALSTSANFWTGATTVGGLSASNCVDWSVSTPSPTEGRTGESVETSQSWLNGGIIAGCDATKQFLCMCYATD